MSIGSQQYADLCEDSYKPRVAKDRVTLGGVTYQVIEHVDNTRNGYQGTIYQRMDTGEVVVAHRGTEFDREPFKDGAIVDGGMALARTNEQIDDATELTRRAIEYAKRSADDYGNRALEVTVAGHSLGGCLAQVTAYKFGLKGETFNAYGAVSLNQGVTSGGTDVTNHVMAGDPVSSASPHFGQVRVYATPREIGMLMSMGYANDRNPLDPRAPVPAAIAAEDSHRMHNFLSVDGDRKVDKSVLADSEARLLAQQFDPMIDKYRGDLALTRGVITFAARDPIGRIHDGINAMRDPQPPGELLRRQERLDSALTWEESRGIADVHRLLPSRETPYHPEVTKPGGGISLPGYLPKSDEHDRLPLKHDETPGYKGMPLSGITPGHPDHALYAELKQALPTSISEDRLAQITVAAKVGGVRAGQLDGIHIDEQSLQVFVSGKIPGNRCCVDLATPPPTAQETLQRSEAFDQQQAQQLAQLQAEQQSISAQTKSGPGMAFG
jgi:pimeloyl-ACP methyl ester carboxylesterase